MKTKKKDRNYIPILDQPIEELKKPMGDGVDFNAIMKRIRLKRKGAINDDAPITF